VILVSTLLRFQWTTSVIEFLIMVFVGMALPTPATLQWLIPVHCLKLPLRFTAREPMADATV